MRYLFALVLCAQLLCVQWLTRLNAQTLGAHQAIENYIDSETVLVGWIDLTQIDASKIAAFMGDIDSRPPAPEDLSRIKAIQDALVQLKVKRVYSVSDLSSLVSDPPAVILPCENAQAVALFLGSMVGKSGYLFEQDGQNVIGGMQPTLESLKTKRGEVTPQLVAAIESCTSPHGVALATPAYVTMSAMAILSPMLEQSEIAHAAKLAESLASIQWLSISATLPPNSATLRIQTNSASEAASLVIALKILTKSLEERASLLEFQVEQTAAILTATSTDDAAKKLLAIRDTFNRSGPPQSANSMKQIALALHNYCDVHQSLPPQSLVDAKGNRLLSWRVLILPYLEQQSLYNQFHLDEAWDSPHNLKLAEIIPQPYATSGQRGPGPQQTRILAPLTKDTAFGRAGSPMTFRDIKDGTSNTIWFLEAAKGEGVIWTKPEDLQVDDTHPVQSIMLENAKGFWGSRMDGSVQFIDREHATDEIVRALLTVDGGEVIKW